MKFYTTLKRLIFMFILLAGMFTKSAYGQKRLQDDLNKHKINQKVDSLLDKMTLKEKIGQLNLLTSDMTTTGPSMRSNYQEYIKEGKVGAIFNAYGADYTRKLQKMAVEKSRLGIPILFGYDVIHGFRTIFPIPLGQSASWDLQLIKQSEHVAAREAAAEGLHWTFTPMVDIARDPRWGRVAEGAGEDTYLGSKIAVARVRGIQGNDLGDVQTIMACVKHYAAYGAAEGGRDYNTVNMSKRKLRNAYLPPFKAAVDAGVATVMTSFNEFNGIPATANTFLLNTILHDEWGFNGFVVTDYTAIPEMITHGVPADSAQAAEMAFKANVDMDMQSEVYLKELPKLVKSGKIRETQINESVRRILRMKYRLGLFKDPYRYSNESRQKKEILSDKNKETARQLARESMVLLKNKGSLLPLGKDIKSLAVIGPLADNQEVLLGPWSGAGRKEDNDTVLQGIRDAVSSSTEINYAEGTGVMDTSTAGFKEAVNMAKNADVAVMVLGEDRNMSGEASSRATLDLPGNQQALLKAVQKTGTPVVLVLMNGRPLTIAWSDTYVSSILETWFAGIKGGHAISDILFGDYNPSGKLTVTFPRTVGQVPYYYNHKNTGRPGSEQHYTSKYIDVKNEPLYPFGYGLSYTSFSYQNLQLSSEHISPDDSIKVTVDIRNIGNRKGTEIAQLYIRDLFGSVTRPVKELKGFKRVSLEPKETQTVSFWLTPDKLAFYNIDMKRVVEPGRFKVFVGTNSQDLMQDEFEVTQK